MTHLGVDLARNSQPRTYRTEEEKQHHAKHSHLRLHRFASFLAQILCPLAPLFSLPALTEGWYVKRNADNLITAVQADPPLIVAVGVITLLLSVFSNVSILFRLIDVHCRLFTFSTIALLATHVVLSLVTVLVFAFQPGFHSEGFQLSTAYYLTILSAAVALFVSLALVFDGWQTEWYKSKGTGLSGSQCSLVISFDLFLATMLIGTCCFRYLLEDVSYVDSLYFVTQCAITTGYGDIVPVTTGARIFMLVFFLFGILQFAILVCFTRATALEAMQDGFKAKERTILKSFKRRKGSKREGNEGKGDQGAPDPQNLSKTMTRQEKLVGLRYEEAIVKLQKERNRDFRSQLFVSLILVLFVWLCGAAAYTKLEGWTYFEAVYFCWISFSTIGLGDFTPKTEGGRAFFCIWALLGAGVLTVFFSILADGYSSTFKETFQRNILAQLMRRLGRSNGDKKLTSDSAETNPTVSTLAQIATYREQDQDGVNKQAANKPVFEDEGLALLKILDDTRRHLNHLITSGGDGEGEEVNAVVRQLMDEQGFKRRNREKVECDSNLKRFLYLRSLQAKFAELEQLATSVCRERSSRREWPESSSYSMLSSSMSYSSSIRSESTLAGDEEVRSRKGSSSSEG